MTRDEKNDLLKIINGQPFQVRARIQAYLDNAAIETKRTETQNAALHLFFNHLAKELNDAGYNVQVVLSKKMECDWNERLVKELLWRPAQRVLLGKDSTTELGKQGDIDTVYEHLNRHLGEKFGIHVPFPTEEQKNYYKVGNTSIPYPDDYKEPTI